MAIGLGTNPRNPHAGLIFRIFVATLIALFLVYLLLQGLSPSSFVSSSSPPSYLPLDGGLSSSIKCPSLPLADDVVVVFKTGVTEHERVPAHVKTDLSCIPHLLTGSDVDEHVDGLYLEDALKDISDEVMVTEPDFEFYRHIHTLIEEGHPLEEASSWATHAMDKESSQPWKLDKWKFLPLLRNAVGRHPSAKWYIFMEADTYMIWPMMLELLARYDHNQPYYLGASNYIGGNGYAHGGSGYVLSHNAAHAAVDWINSESEKAYDLVHNECCGDLVIGLVLKELDMYFTESWPTIQGETPATQDYTSRHWCVPIATFHHMDADDILGMWEFEQSWTNFSNPIMHSDVFRHFTQPQLRSTIYDWDNLSSREPSLSTPGDAASESVEACRSFCEENDTCLQFSYRLGECQTSPILRRGSASDVGSITSGFMLERIENFVKDLGECSIPRWPDR